MEHPMPATAFICVTCGTQYPPSESAPARCPICEDDRQYVNPDGQQWTTPDALRASHTNRFTQLGPHITAITTEPSFAIPHRAYLIETDAGNILWDCLAHLDDPTIAELRRRGGIQAIAISHPHFYTTMGAWSRAFDDAPISLHRANEPWVMYPTPAIRYFDGEAVEPLPGFTLVRCGGHFPGSSALHWAGGEHGAGTLLTGDTIRVCADARWLTFMYSFPNQIPLDERTVRTIVRAVDPFAFDRIYDGWTATPTGAKAAVARSADRYLAHLRGEASS
jgi:glyoxylase-like metal-dependent hydrolase (beta-lactamase superfamily II)